MACLNCSECEYASRCHLSDEFFKTESACEYVKSTIIDFPLTNFKEDHDRELKMKQINDDILFGRGMFVDSKVYDDEY